jgi:hypothetical protein
MKVGADDVDVPNDGSPWPKTTASAAGAVVVATDDGYPWLKMKADLDGFSVAPIDDGDLWPKPKADLDDFRLLPLMMATYVRNLRLMVMPPRRRTVAAHRGQSLRWMLMVMWPRRRTMAAHHNELHLG